MKKQIKTTLIILALALLAIGAAVIYTGCFTSRSTKVAGANEAEELYTCSMHPWIIQKGPGNCPICGMRLVKKENTSAESASADRKILYWVSSMDPSYIRQEPGKDTMGMDLVPVYEGQAETGNVVTVDPSIIQSIGVRYATVQRGPMSMSIDAPAHVDYDEDRLSVLSTRAEGYIDKLYVTSPGTKVKAGDPLFDFYSPKLYSAQEEYLIALRSGDSRFAGAARERLKLLGISDEQIDGVRRKGSSHALTITAPIDGTVVAMGTSGTGGGLSSGGEGSLVTGGGMGGGGGSSSGGMGGMGGGGGSAGGGGFSDSGGSGAVGGMSSGSGGSLRAGSFVPAGSPLFTIADLSTVWVYAHIYDDQLPYVHQGMAAKLELDYLPGQTFDGQIDFVYPYLERTTRDVRIRVVFANPDGRLLPEMYGKVKIESPISDDALIVPEEAVVFSGDHHVVFLSLPGGKFAPVEVKVGPSDGNGRVQVLSGLAEGQTIVTSAQFLLDAESRMQEAISKMLSGQGNAPAVEQTPAAPGETTSTEGADNSVPGMDMSGGANARAANEATPAPAPPEPARETRTTEPPKPTPPSAEASKTSSGETTTPAVEKPAETWPNLAPDDPNAKWECPMPGDRWYAAEPGTDPTCGMKLVPHDPAAWAREHKNKAGQ